MATVWLEQQKALLTTQQSSFVTFKPTNTKRKRTDRGEISNKRKIIIYSKTRNDSDDDDERLSLSPRVAPILPKVTKSSRFVHRSVQSMTLFKCQLCRRCLRNKDIYMDHMVMCARQRKASVKIVRAERGKDEVSIL